MLILFLFTFSKYQKQKLIFFYLFRTNGQLTFSAIGSFELFSGDELNLSTRFAVLSGESLEVSSAAGSINFLSDHSTSDSSALSFNTKNAFSVSSSGDINFDAQQSIEVVSSHTSINTAGLTLEARRNNILLEGYSSLSLSATSLDIAVKGDATIESANGNLLFSQMDTVQFTAKDDIQLNSHDSVRFATTNGDISLKSTGNTYLVADAESFYSFNGLGSFTGVNSFSSVSGEFFLESTAGDILLSNTGGDFVSTSSDYTHLFADAKLTISATNDVTFVGEQDFDIRAERGRFYVNKLPASPSSSAPITFDTTFAYFDAGDLTINVEEFTIDDADDIRFETADEARDAVQDWNIEDDMDFSADTFYLGSSNVQIISGDDLTFLVNVGASFEAVNNPASAIIINNQFEFTETATNAVNHIAREWTLAPNGDLTLTTDQDFAMNGREGVRISGDTSVAFTSENDIISTFDWNSYYQGQQIFLETLDGGDVEFNGGKQVFDLRADLDITASSFELDSANGDLDADSSATYNIDGLAEYDAGRYIIINGDLLINEYSLAQFEGNLIIASPPSTDINISADDIDANGPTTLEGYTVNINVDNDARFTPFSFTMTSETEEPISINVGQNFNVNGEDVTFKGTSQYNSPTVDLNRNYEMYFQAADDASIGANTINIAADHEFVVFTSGLSNWVASSQEWSAAEFESNSKGDTTFTTNQDMNFSFHHNSRYVAEHNDLSLNAAGATFNSENEFFFRAHEDISFTAAGEININSPRTFSFKSGNVDMNAGDDAIFTSEDDIDIHAFESFDVSALGTLDIEATTKLEIHGSDVNLDALNDLNLSSTSTDTQLSTGPNLPFTFTQTNAGGTNTITAADDLRFQSNDMLLMTVGGNWQVNVANDQFLIETSAQHGGQLFYADESFAFDATNIDVLVRDSSLHGGFIHFDSFTDVTFTGADVEIEVTGSEYDPHFDTEYGILYRSESANVASDAAQTYLEGWRGLEHRTFTGLIEHNTNVDNIVIESTNEGMSLRSGHRNRFVTAVGDFVVSLSEYSIWEASDSIVVQSTLSSLSLESTTGDIDLIADRGEVQFRYKSTDVMDFIAKSIVADGADSFAWSFGGRFDTDSVDLEIFGDSYIEFDSSSPSNTNAQLVWTIGKDTDIISSFNNDIRFTSNGGSLTSTATESISFYGGRDVVYSGTLGGVTNTFTTGANMKMTSEGSVGIFGTGNVAFTSAASLTMTSNNLIQFDSIDTITIGTTTTPSIVTMNAGGDNTDHGVSITSDARIVFESDADTTLTAAEFFTRSAGASTISGQDSTSIRSTGSDAASSGSDITFESEGKLDSLSTVSTTFTSAAIRFEYDGKFDITSGNNLLLQSAQFIDIDADGKLSFTTTNNNWQTTANTQLYQSADTTTYTIATDSTFTTSQTVSLEADNNMLFGGATSVLFQTAGTNSPITFETQGVISEFNMEFDGTGTFTSTGKTEITGDNGVLFRSEGAITLNSDDDFTIDTNGDLIMNSNTDSITLTGTNTVGSGSRFNFESGATLFQHAGKTITLQAADQIELIPDEDLEIISFYNEDNTATSSNAQILITLTDDIIAAMGDDFNFDVGSAAFIAGTMDWVFNGVSTDGTYGLQITSEDDSFTAIATAGDFFLDANNFMFEGATGTVEATVGSVMYTTTGDMDIATTELPSAVSISSLGGTNIFSAVGTVNVNAFGTDPTSGWIDVTGTTISYTATNANLQMLLRDGSLVLDNSKTTTAAVAKTTININNQAVAGTAFFEAKGGDENGVGIEIVGSKVEFKSDTTINIFADDVFFLETPFDFANGFVGFETVHDQTYTSSGKGERGNGIEVISSVSGRDIDINADNVHFEATGRLSVISDDIVLFTSQYDTDIITHSSMFITGEGNSVDENSVLIAAEGSNGANIAGTIEFNADDDIILTASNNLIASADSLIFVSTQTFIMEGGAIELDARDVFTWNGNTANVQSGDDVVVTVGDDITWNGLGSGTITAGAGDSLEGGGDIYFGKDDILIGKPPGDTGVTFGGPNLSFDAILVDVPSHNALIVPDIADPADCGAAPFGLWFNTNGVNTNPVDLVFCSGNTGAPHRISLI